MTIFSISLTTWAIFPNLIKMTVCFNFCFLGCWFPDLFVLCDFFFKPVYAMTTENLSLPDFLFAHFQGWDGCLGFMLKDVHLPYVWKIFSPKDCSLGV